MTCTKCQQPINKGEKYHRTKQAGPMPPVLIMDGYTVVSQWSDGGKRIIVRQGAMGVDGAVAIIHVPAHLLPLLAKALGGA